MPTVYQSQALAGGIDKLFGRLEQVRERKRLAELEERDYQTRLQLQNLGLIEKYGKKMIVGPEGRPIFVEAPEEKKALLQMRQQQISEDASRLERLFASARTTVESPVKIPTPFGAFEARERKNVPVFTPDESKSNALAIAGLDRSVQDNAFNRIYEAKLAGSSQLARAQLAREQLSGDLLKEQIETTREMRLQSKKEKGLSERQEDAQQFQKDLAVSRHQNRMLEIGLQISNRGSGKISDEAQAKMIASVDQFDLKLLNASRKSQGLIPYKDAAEYVKDIIKQVQGATTQQEAQPDQAKKRSLEEIFESVK